MPDRNYRNPKSFGILLLMLLLLTLNASVFPPVYRRIPASLLLFVLFNLLWLEASSVKACSHHTFPPSTLKLGNSFVRQSTQKVRSWREEGGEKSLFFISASKALQTNSSTAAGGFELHFFF